MANFNVTKSAYSDLIAIGLYTEEEWGRNQRNTYLKQVDTCFMQIAQNPKLGTNCDYIKAGYRKFPQGSHIIFYRQNSESLIDIVRVLHKNMDVVSKFDET
jgi:toxin ParE1/3/4